MQELAQALEEVKNLHQKVFGQPAPDLGPQSYFPFPPGVDPLDQALREVAELRRISEQLSLAPRPGAWTPLADTLVKDDEFVVRLEVPGIPREDLKVLVIGEECVVRGERKQPVLDEPMRPLSMERPRGPFERRFVPPAGSRLDDMKAKAVDGVLELRIPMKKLEPVEEKKVEVS